MTYLTFIIAIFNTLLAVGPTGYCYCKCLHQHELYFPWYVFLDKPHGSMVIFLISTVLALTATYYLLVSLKKLKVNQRIIKINFILTLIFAFIPRLGDCYPRFEHAKTFWWCISLMTFFIISLGSILMQRYYLKKLKV